MNEQELPGSDRPANTLPAKRQALFVLAMEPGDGP
jgi:hypothetical protein